MKLSEIIMNVNKSKENEQWVCLDDLCEELNISGGWGIQDEKENMKAYWFAKWVCTDTWVGGRVYFLYGKPVAVSWQSGRKSPENFEFISTEAADNVRKYLYSLIQEDDDSAVVIANLDEEMGEGYKIQYGSQVLVQESITHEPTGKQVNIIQTFRGMGEIKSWETAVVRFKESGRIADVPMESLLFPFCLEEK